ncbi:hypothetical protein [Streptomyces brevispora]|uniref:hypothetical protein n=1 Tax=Streptomyces brevispora TaxID=887462 RepID=UPI0035E1398A
MTTSQQPDPQQPDPQQPDPQQPDPQQPAFQQSDPGRHYPEYHPGSARPELNRPVHERYPQIRATSGYGDPRVRHTGPGPGAGSDQEPERSSKLTARLTLAMTVVIGQLWGLTVIIDEWMKGNSGTAWWGAGFLCLSFLVVLGLWALDPKDR